MAEVIGAELHVEPVLGLPVGTIHDAGIVDQDINLLLLVQEILGAFSHRSQGGEIELFIRDYAPSLARDLIRRFLGLVLISAQNDHFRSSLAHVQGGHLADAGVGAC